MGGGGGVSTLPFTDHTFRGRSSELGAREGGVSPSFGSKEGWQAYCPWALKEGPLLQKGGAK